MPSTTDTPPPQPPLAQAGFTKLSPIVRLLRPSSTTTTPHSSKVLILCTWMDAGPKVISKYTSEYIKLFPNHTILLVTVSAKEMFLTSTPKYHELLRPAVDVIKGSLEGGGVEGGEVVAAIYSNGGAHTLAAISTIYRDTTSSSTSTFTSSANANRNKSLPISKLLIDSAPGDPTDLGSGQRAIIQSFPSSIRPIISLPLWAAMYLWSFLFSIGICSNPILKLFNALVDESVFPLEGEKKRTYVYSKADKIVSYKGVESSAELSKRNGWDTRLERFEGSRHVMHAVLDKERYWGLVKETLE